MAEDEKTSNHEAEETNEEKKIEAIEIVSGDEPQLPTRGLQVIANTMNTIADTQRAVLNSQQSNRDLINVIVQDNFKLKDENAKLRGRMFELELTLSEVQRKDGERIRALEGRITQLERTSERGRARNPEYSEYPSQETTRYTTALEERRGCFAQIFGL